METLITSIDAVLVGVPIVIESNWRPLPLLTIVGLVPWPIVVICDDTGGGIVGGGGCADATADAWLCMVEGDDVVTDWTDWGKWPYWHEDNCSAVINMAAAAAEDAGVGVEWCWW